jgi:hypothetical protein
MRKVLLVAALVLLTPAILSAQQPKWSLGATAFGVTYFSEAKAFEIALPGGGAFNFPAMYVGFYPHEKIAVMPGATVIFLSPDEGDTFYDLYISLLITYQFMGHAENSFYVGVLGDFNAFDPGGASTTDFAAGGAVGYRLVPFDFFAVRLEGSYRRWFDFEENQFTGTVKVEVNFN